MTDDKPTPKRSNPLRRRASGAKQVDEVTREESKQVDEGIESSMPSDPHLPEEGGERRPKFRTPGFSRMRVEWTKEDAATITSIRTIINRRIINEMGDAYRIMNELFELVRQPEVDANGEPVRDEYGYIKWARDENGLYVEDWSKLTTKEKERFLFLITTRLFAWQELAADAWAESMFAKARWEEAFSIRYQEPDDGTIEDRTAYAKDQVAEDRYFAVFTAAYSRRVDALVRSMETLAQRLKDALSA